jgi:RNA polymerase sigma factor (sigma-70 family)
MVKAKWKKEEARKVWDYWYPIVYGFFYRRLNDRHFVEDLTASTINALLLEENIKDPKVFIWQTARNQLINYIRDNNKRPVTLSLEYEYMAEKYSKELEVSLDNESYHYQSKVKQLTDCCQRSLKDQDYDIVMRSIVQNQRSLEIGNELNESPDAIRKKLQKALLKLKTECTDLWIEINLS